MNPRVVWKKKASRFQTGSSGWVGPFKVCETHYNSARPKGTPGFWEGKIFLPGVCNHVTCCQTEVDARAACVALVTRWFSDIKEYTT